jgi:hypothetical protein
VSRFRVLLEKNYVMRTTHYVVITYSSSCVKTIFAIERKLVLDSPPFVNPQNQRPRNWTFQDQRNGKLPQRPIFAIYIAQASRLSSEGEPVRKPG